MRPADAKTVADFLLVTLETEIPVTLRVFNAVPDDKLDYRPDSVSKSALDLLRHITLEDEWFLNAVSDGQFGPLPDQSDTCGLMTPADAIAQYTARVPPAIERVRAVPSEALARHVDLMGAFQMPAVGFLSLMLRHSVHHRGQLSSYLRSMGAKVPGIYGPSADTVMLSA
jgi:uncharacterized damage-inducible protein DinB